MDARAVHYCVYAANDYAPWSKVITLVSPEWSPEDEAKATKACTNKAGQVRLHNNNTSNHPSAHSATLSPLSPPGLESARGLCAGQNHVDAGLQVYALPQERCGSAHEAG